MAVSIDDFKKLEIKVGQILSVEKIENTDKLLKLSVDFNEGTFRQIISGISSYFSDPQVLVGKKCAFATNLEPRVIMGLESQGMILAVSGLKQSKDDLEDSFFSLLEVEKDVPAGSAVK
ncbi:MAG: methionine--tRNA ligase [Candidatus Paceibacterota bacterium]|jgi:methionyl-tRNA synthetase